MAADRKWHWQLRAELQLGACEGLREECILVRRQRTCVASRMQKAMRGVT